MGSAAAQLKGTPPPGAPVGYPVDQLPAFLRSTAATAKIESAPSDGKSIAEVDPQESTNTIRVREPKMFTPGVEAHELTHVWDDTRNPGVIQRENEMIQSGTMPMGYDYGGMAGLMKARLARKTIADYGPEQRAEMVKDFQEATQEAIRRGDAAQLDKVNAAYAPFVRQEAALPDRNDPMTSIDVTPKAPGLPPATESGILAPDRLIGGDERLLAYPGAPPSPMPKLKQKFKNQIATRR